MPEQNRNEPLEETIRSVEASIVGPLIDFHKKTSALLRNSNLNDDSCNLVADRVKRLLGEITAEMKETRQLNLEERLDGAYEETRQYVTELSELQARGRE